jgi:hypothetical protein
MYQLMDAQYEFGCAENMGSVGVYSHLHDHQVFGSSVTSGYRHERVWPAVYRLLDCCASVLLSGVYSYDVPVPDSRSSRAIRSGRADAQVEQSDNVDKSVGVLRGD